MRNFANIRSRKILKILGILLILVQTFSCTTEIEPLKQISEPGESSSSNNPSSSSSQNSSSSSQNSIQYYCDYGPPHSEGGGGCIAISGPEVECGSPEYATKTTSCATIGNFCYYGPYCASCVNKGGCWPIRTTTDSQSCVNNNGSFVSVCPANSL